MFVLKLIATLVALGWCAVQVLRSIRLDEKTGNHAVDLRRIGISALVPVMLVFVVLPSFGQVPAGARGVVLRFGAVSGRTLDEGLYAVIPFVESVAIMDVQVHAGKAKATAASHDLQNVATEVTVNYRVDARRAGEVYRDLRQDYVDRILDPAIQEAVKSATAEFDAERLVIDRPLVKAKIEEFLSRRASQHGLIVDGIAITDFQFSADFSNAIEAKVTSQQLALKAKNDVEIIRNQQEQKIVTARADSFQTVTNAKAEAEAIRIKVQAVNAQGGRDYVALKWIEKWSGAPPSIVTSDKAGMLLTMPQTEAR